MAPSAHTAPSRPAVAALLASCLALPAAARILKQAQMPLFLDRGGRSSLSVVGSPAETCVGLKNHASYFTVQIGVGTPPQLFDVVADTGSDAVIVDSCICVQTGRCHPQSKCFHGTNKSSTFSITGVDLSSPLTKATPPMVQIGFGSGTIQAVVGSDVVQVGGISAMMHDGVLLMVAQQLENIRGPFEGILGLGLPRKDSGGHLDKVDERAKTYSAKGFLQEAGISRFSVCFGTGGHDGVLRIGSEAGPEALGSVGKFHWGLDFRGITVGNESMEVRASFCDAGSVHQGQSTACGAIPDSGTTVITAPRDQLKELFNMVCDSWPMCAEGVALAERKHLGVPKHAILNYLLERCEDWLDEDGLNGLPTLSLTVAGADGRTKTLRLTPESYVLQFMAEEVHVVRKHLEGLGDIRIEEPTGKRLKVCSMAFGASEYTTQDNGPIWILGQPLFFQYTVGYDLAAQPPAVSFAEGPCFSCDSLPQEAADEKPVFVGRGASVHMHAHGRGASGVMMPRPMSGPLRIPERDPSVPL